MPNYRPVTTRREAEFALDAGRLFCEMHSGAYWRVRRNGRTVTWKTRPDDFRIPVKAGLRSTGQLEPASLRFFYVECDA